MDYTTDQRGIYKEGSIRMPYREFTQPDRMRGKWMDVFMFFSNLENLQVNVSSLTSIMRVSARP